tara:strand:+ start:406 stop:561 length:156 start_codon:yes stop_codon:yes gene_type:complete
LYPERSGQEANIEMQGNHREFFGQLEGNKQNSISCGKRGAPENPIPIEHRV